MAVEYLTLTLNDGVTDSFTLDNVKGLAVSSDETSQFVILQISYDSGSTWEDAYDNDGTRINAEQASAKTQVLSPSSFLFSKPYNSDAVLLRFAVTDTLGGSIDTNVDASELRLIVNHF